MSTMTDNGAEMLYMAWRSERLAFEPDLPSWGNVRDPDVRRAWDAAAEVARKRFERALDPIRAAARAYAAAVNVLGLAADDDDPKVIATAEPIGAAQAHLWIALGIYDDEYRRLVEEREKAKS